MGGALHHIAHHDHGGAVPLDCPSERSSLEPVLPERSFRQEALAPVGRPFLYAGDNYLTGLFLDDRIKLLYC